MGGKKAAGGGKKAKAAAKKAEQAAERARLEEERLKQEEADRLQRIEDERLRREAEDCRQQGLAIKRTVDAKRIVEEKEADEQEEADVHDKKLAMQREQRDRAEWDNVFKCDVLPDAANEPDLTCYLTLWREETFDAKVALDECEAGEALLAQLDVLVVTAKQDMDNGRMRWVQAKILEIVDTMHKQLDTLTATLLVDADRDGVTMTSNVLKQRDAETIKYGLWTTGHVKLKRSKGIDFEAICVTADPPNTLTMLSNNGMGLVVLYTSHDPFEVANKSRMCSYGGVYQVQAVELPLPSFMLQDWVVREINGAFGSVQERPYPGHAATDNSASAIQPVKLSWKISKQTLVDDLPMVGWWDAASSSWVTEGISDVRFNTIDRVISLQSLQLRPLALLHSKMLDYPYTSWSITSFGVNVARIVVQGSRMAVEIELRDDRCTLVRPQPAELAHLIKPMRPNIFFCELQRGGISIIPDDAHVSLVRASPKTRSVEIFGYEQIARVASCADIQNSLWNNRLGSDQAAFCVRVQRLTADASESAAAAAPGLTEAPSNEGMATPAAPTPTPTAGSASTSTSDATANIDETPVQLTIAHSATSIFIAKQTEREDQTWDLDEPEMAGESSHVSLKRVLGARLQAAHRLQLEQTSIVFQESLRSVVTLLRLLS